MSSTQTSQTPRDTFKHLCASLELYFKGRGPAFPFLPILVANLLMFGLALFQVFLPITDPARYQCYALVFWLGGKGTTLLPTSQCSFLHSLPTSPFTSLPLEYPPLTLIPFSLPLLIPTHYYQLAFALLMAATILLTCWLLLRFAPTGSTLAFTLYLLLGSFALALLRYDLLPALCTLLCVIAADRRRWSLAYVSLALGTLLKLYPLLFLPSLLLAQQYSEGHLPQPSIHSFQDLPTQIWRSLRTLPGWQWRHLLLFMALLFGVTALFALIDFHGAVLSQIQYFVQRPLHIESTGATLLWFTHLLGTPWQIVYTFGSLNITSLASSLVSPLLTAAILLALLATLYLQWCGSLSLVQAFIALTLAFLTTGKVFSPQYLLWLIPLLVYSGAFSTFWLITWGSFSLLTTFIYAYFYLQIPDYLHIPDPLNMTLPAGFFEVTALRNALLLFITLAYLGNWFSARAQSTGQPLPSQ